MEPGIIRDNPFIVNQKPIPNVIPSEVLQKIRSEPIWTLLYSDQSGQVSIHRHIYMGPNAMKTISDIENIETQMNYIDIPIRTLELKINSEENDLKRLKEMLSKTIDIWKSGI